MQQKQQPQPITYFKSFHHVLIRLQQKWLKQKVGHFVLRSINLLIWSKEDLPEQCKEWTVLIYKKHDKVDCTNYRAVSLLSTTYKILSYVLLSRLTPYAVQIIWDCQCRFWRNRSDTDYIFCIHQIHMKKMEYNEAVHQLFRDFRNAYNSVGGRSSVIFSMSLVCPWNW
jgi:hypothetical protein